MDNMDATGFLILCLVLVSLMGGSLITKLVMNLDLKECAKAHDVYECEWVAVPKINKEETK